MSYIEQGVYWYIRNVLFGGLKTLFSAEYSFYTVLAFFIMVLAAFNPVMVRWEAVAALSFIIGAWHPMLFPMSFVVLLFVPGVKNIAWAFAPLWGAFTALIALLVPRDLVTSWGGYAIFFGNPKGHVPFNFIFNIVFALGAAASVAMWSPLSPAILAVSAAMFYINNVVAKHERNDRFAFALSVFYFSMLYYFLSSTSPSFSGFAISNALVSAFTFIFAVQGNTRIMRSRVAPHAAVFLTLGLALGFHASGIYSIEAYQLVSSLAIFPVSIVLFLSSDRVYHYFTRQPSVTSALINFGRDRIGDFLKNLRK